jgi:hypothetical protein
MTPVARETDRTQVQLMLGVSHSLRHRGVVPLTVLLAPFYSLPSGCDVLCTETLHLLRLQSLAIECRQNVMNCNPTSTEVFKVQWLVYVPPVFTCMNFAFPPTQCICVFRVVLTINSDCFPKQH